MIIEILLSALIYVVCGIITAFAYKHIRTKFYGVGDSDTLDDMACVASLWPLIVIISIFVIPFNLLEFVFYILIEKINVLIASRKQKV